MSKEQSIDAKTLYEAAQSALQNAYVPFSGFSVGAALLTSDGKVYTGVNVENSSYGATICAERTAFVKAISEGERSFAAIAVAAKGPDGETAEALPCGICRQFMFEFAPELIVITGTADGQINVRDLSQLLPLGFRLER